MIEDEAKTKWLPVPGWEGMYEVSDAGEVRSLDRMKPYRDSLRRAAGCVLSPSFVKGYPRVNLWFNGRQIPHLVHTLVAAAHLPVPPTPAHQINHKDGDRANPRAGNLEWMTASENLRHAYRELGRKPAGGKSLGPDNGRYIDGRRSGLAGAPQ